MPPKKGETLCQAPIDPLRSLCPGSRHLLI